jgi:hypothetical protein
MQVFSDVTYERSGQLDDEGQNREQERQDLEEWDIDNDRNERSRARSGTR